LFRQGNILIQIGQNPGDFAVWHRTCSGPGVSKAQSRRAVDVFVVDTPQNLGATFGVPSSDAESTHVLCRHTDETTPDFSRRVLRRIQRIQQTRRVRALCYVVGAGASTMSRSEQVLPALVPLLEEGSSLTVVGPSSHQSEVFECIDAAMQFSRDDLTVRAQFYPEPEPRAPRSSRRPNVPASVASARNRALSPGRHDGWFPTDAGLGFSPPSSDARIQ
jgi:hypothetical protein